MNAQSAPEPAAIGPDTPVGDIARDYPQAIRVLHAHGLDYCCGGDAALASACAAAGLEVGTVLTELKDAVPADAPDESWDGRSLTELMRHIVDRFHAAHREQLPELVAMARRVESRHADKQACPSGLAELLEAWASEIEQHMQKEEQVLFPMIERGRGPMATAPIQVMEQEHEDHGANLERVKQLAHRFEAPAEACNTWRALYAGLAAFEEDLMRHVHLENHVLFPRALSGESPTGERHAV